VVGPFLLGKKPEKSGVRSHSRAPHGFGKDSEVGKCRCGRPRFNATTQYCWLHARAVGNLQERTVMEIANCCYADVEGWILAEFLSRVWSVRPKLAAKAEALIQHLDDLTADEGLQFANFSPADGRFLLSRLEEITRAAVGTPA
jgi:hypothetical protein